MKEKKKVSNATYKKVIKQWVDEIENNALLEKIYNFIFHQLMREQH